MEQDMMKALEDLKSSAGVLSEMEISQSFDDEIPEDVQCSLVRMAAGIALQFRLEEYDMNLSEETPEEISDAYFEAQEAIENIVSDAFIAVERYANSSGEIKQRIDELSSDVDPDSLADNLLKLYKCQGIIDMAYQCISKYPLYGTPDNMIKMNPEDEDVVVDQEEYIMQKMGIDIMALLEARQRLMEAIQSKMAEYTA